jgi:hypothetical protein
VSPPAGADPRTRRALRAVRLAHTVVWAFFAGSILAIPVAAWLQRFDLWLGLVGVVMVEVLILAANGMKCPLTGVAARYTDDRRDNFDICLPLTIARYNKEIFGSLYVAGIVLGVVMWLR